MPPILKVYECLSCDQLTELEAFARQPSCTVDKCHQWMLDRGHALSRSAVRNWLREFRRMVMAERFSASGELARTIREAMTGKQSRDVAEAAVMQLMQMLFEKASQLQAEGEIDARELLRMTSAIKNLIASARHIERLKSEVAAALDEAEKITPGARQEAIIAKVRKILSVEEWTSRS